MKDLEIRTYAPGDEQAILKTFNLVFRQVCGEGYVDRTLEQWQWEYPHNPCGMRVMLALTPSGQVAAQYAAVPMAVHSPLGETRFVHAVDSMVHPDFRQGLKKPGLFVEVGRAWLDYIRELGKESVGFGYPVRPAWRIGNRYLGYTLVRVLDYQVGDVAKLQVGPSGEVGLEVERVDSFPEAEVDRLWDRWAQGVDCAVIRNGAYLNWRYTQCPHTDYIGLLARKQGKLVGMAVLHPAHELVPQAMTFAEWILLPGSQGVAKALLQESLHLAKERERARLLVVLPLWSEGSAFFQHSGFSLEPSKHYMERRLGSYLWGELMTSEWLADHWYYSLGDSDLV